MRVDCCVQDCVHWSEDGGDYNYKGGCTLDEITISDSQMTAAGFWPLCQDYEERE